MDAFASATWLAPDSVMRTVRTRPSPFPWRRRVAYPAAVSAFTACVTTFGLRSSSLPRLDWSIPSASADSSFTSTRYCVTLRLLACASPLLSARWVRSNATKNVESRERSRSVSIPPMLNPLLFSRALQFVHR